MSPLGVEGVKYVVGNPRQETSVDNILFRSLLGKVRTPYLLTIPNYIMERVLITVKLTLF